MSDARHLEENQGEEGIAMITAIIVSAIVLTLSLVAVQLADHNLGRISTDRTRVVAFHAAEAGIDTALRRLQITPAPSLPCGQRPPAVLATKPSSSTYTVTYTYYAAFPPVGTAMACADLATTPPRTVVIRSSGTTRDPGSRSRVIEVVAEVKPAPAVPGFSSAMFSQNNLAATNATTITNSATGSVANVYTNGNYSCNNALRVEGSIHAQGNIAMSQSCTTGADVWAGGSVDLSSTGTRVGRDVIAAGALAGTGSVRLTNEIVISRHLIHKTGWTQVSGGPSQIAGEIIQKANQSPPPVQHFPTVTYNQAAWAAAGFTNFVTSSDCPAVANTLRTQSWTQPTVVRVTGCLLTIGPDYVVPVGNNVAIISDWGIRLTGNSEFKTCTGTICPASDRLLYMIVPSGSTCVASTGQGNITMVNDIKFNNPKVFIYTPCTAILRNTTVIRGQVYGQAVDLSNAGNIQYEPAGLIPGAAPVPNANSHDISISYRREVAPS